MSLKLAEDVLRDRANRSPDAITLAEAYVAQTKRLNGIVGSVDVACGRLQEAAAMDVVGECASEVQAVIAELRKELER